MKPGWCGWKEAKSRIIEALTSDNIAHEQRPDQMRKNLLFSGGVNVAFVGYLVGLTTGNMVTFEAHDLMPDVQVWILRPMLQSEKWYLKCYIKSDVVFISVHR